MAGNQQTMAKEGEKKSGASVLILGHKCYRCGHEWRPYNLDDNPRVCPKCKSPYWDRPKVRNNSAKRGRNPTVKV